MYCHGVVCVWSFPFWPPNSNIVPFINFDTQLPSQSTLKEFFYINNSFASGIGCFNQHCSILIDAPSKAISTQNLRICLFGIRVFADMIKVKWNHHRLWWGLNPMMSVLGVFGLWLHQFNLCLFNMCLCVPSAFLSSIRTSIISLLCFKLLLIVFWQNKQTKNVFC